MSLLQIIFEVSVSVNVCLNFEWEVLYLATWKGQVYLHYFILFACRAVMKLAYDCVC